MSDPSWLRLRLRRGGAGCYHYFPDTAGADPVALCGRRLGGRLIGPIYNGWPRYHSDCGACIRILMRTERGAPLRAAIEADVDGR